LEDRTLSKLTIGFGALLTILGVVGFAMTGAVHPTALIPCWFGLALVVCGTLATTPDAKRRMLWMHIAVTIGLLGWVFPLVRVVGAAHQGVPLVPSTAHAAMLEQEAMILLCFLFTVLCVRSFVAARRARV
jgi:hypothetical protein